MCGIAGFWDASGVNPESACQFGKMMANAIAHRGPDDDGIWHSEQDGIILTHRRLSIIDLSPAGKQPMVSPSDRYIVVFNGEIYNHLILKKELEDSNSMIGPWQGHSDTEILLVAMEYWGIEETLKRTVGMFSIAIWDRRDRVLTLARDRMGEKPLYYGWQKRNGKSVFLFGSELKALKMHPCFEGKVDRDSLTLFLRHSYVPAPYSIYEGIVKLLPGHLLQLRSDDFRLKRLPKSTSYWSLTEMALSGVSSPLKGNQSDLVDQLDALLLDVVGQQMVADVPLGAFLSGGIDSSTIVALMQARSSRPVKTFSIGFHEEGYNEAVHAKAVAKYIGTDHTELYVSPEESMEVIPKLPKLYDEPFADSSQIPTFLVSQLAKREVTVSLSGDGGDELFCGYNRYTLTDKLWNMIQPIPVPLRKILASLITSVPTRYWTSLSKFLPSVSSNYANFGDKMHKGAGALTSRTVEDLYLTCISQTCEPDKLVINGSDPQTHLTRAKPDLNGLGRIERMMVLDSISYLPDDILVKVDRAAMGLSLETRIPFLDHRVLEFAWKIPHKLKLNHGESKWILRQVLYKYVPKELIERPKMGFGVPIDAWLRGPLREWAENLLDESRLLQEGFFHPDDIRLKWAEHLSGQKNWHYFLWNILMFQAWLSDVS
jgi:asparagine synthase (glutamine-hydrolysing)